jgi:hypothetical protein
MLKGEVVVVLIAVLFVMTVLRRLKSAGTTIVDRSFIFGFSPFRLTTPIGPSTFHTRIGVCLTAATLSDCRRSAVMLLFWPPRPPFRFHMRIILAG